MKRITRSISVLLIVCLLFSVTGVSAMAGAPEDEPVMDGQQSAPVDVHIAVAAAGSAEAPGNEEPAPTEGAAPAEETSLTEAPAAPTPAAPAPAAPAPAAEAPAASGPVAETSAPAAPAMADVPAVAEAPAAPAPAAEAPAAPAPAAEAPAASAPVAEASAPAAPAMADVPAVAEAPAAADIPAADVPAEAEAPTAAETPATDAPAASEAPAAGEISVAGAAPAAEKPAALELADKEPASEEPGSEEPGSEEPASEEPGSEEPGSEEPASEESSSEESDSEEPVTETSGAGESSAVVRSVELQVGDQLITVTGELPEGAELKVVKIPDDIVAALAGKATLFSYDICLIVDGEVWQPEDYDKDVEVTICDAEEENREGRVRILHVKTSVIDGEGKLSEDTLASALKGLTDGSVGKENLNTDKNANRFSFKTSSFSMFLAQSYLLVSNTENTGSGEENGIVLDGEGKFDVLITGTLETDGTPVLISDSVTPDKVSITVWKIDGAVEDEKGEEHVVAEGRPGVEPKIITEDSRAVEKSIHYIIRIEPSQEDMIDLSGTEKVHGYDTATENSTVTLKVKVPDGYTLTGAYNGEGKEYALEKDDDGNYYVVVPRGGGVYLSVEMKKNEDHDSDWGDWSYSWTAGTEKKEEDEDRFRVITFDFNGGTLKGSAGPVFVRAEIGETVTLLEAPTRPGYRFVRWASAPAVSVSMPGESFTVTERVRFVAVWDGPAWSVGGDHDDDDDDDDDDEDEGPDVTETVRIDKDSDEELNLSSVRVTGEKATGIKIISATQEIDVDRDITVKGGSKGATGIDIITVGRTITDEVETGDGVTVSAAGGDAAGIYTEAKSDGHIDLEVEGDTRVSSDSGESTGIAAYADRDSSVTIAIEGDLSTRG